MRTLSAAGRALRVPLLLALPAFVIQAWPALARLVEYDRMRVASGQLWRLLTCHWAHWSWEHAVLDALVLTLVGAVYTARGGRRMLPLLTVAAVTISACVWLLLPELDRYRGLSGLDAALTALLATTMIRSSRSPFDLVTSTLAVAGIGGKIAFELWSGQAAFVDSASAGFVPVPLAHLAGGLTGIAAGIRFPSQAAETSRSSWRGGSRPGSGRCRAEPRQST